MIVFDCGSNAIVTARDGSRTARQVVKQSLRKGLTLIVIGPGGVGKTTVAAALGLAAASQGLGTGVITVDPARRLRDALGLPRLSAKPFGIDPRRLRAAGFDPAIRIAAMVLEVQRAWDSLVERFVPSVPARQRILANSFYRGLSGQFAGAEAYAALEQFYQLRTSGTFDTIVVDTPPAAHTFEFIEAPANLQRLLESRTARWLAGRQDGRKPLALASSAMRFVATQLERFAGVKTLAAASEFFAATLEAAAGLSDRFRAIAKTMRSRDVEFVLVTTAEPSRLVEAREAIARMQEDGLRLRAIVLNRLADECSITSLGGASRLRAIASMREAIADDQSPTRPAIALANFLAQHEAVTRARLQAAAVFARDVPARTEIILAPEFAGGLRDLAGLKRVADLLVCGGGRQALNAIAKTVKSPPNRRPDETIVADAAVGK